MLHLGLRHMTWDSGYLISEELLLLDDIMLGRLQLLSEFLALVKCDKVTHDLTSSHTTLTTHCRCKANMHTCSMQYTHTAHT